MVEKVEVTRELSRFTENLRYEALPLEAVEQARLCFLDWLGVTLGGSGHQLVDILTRLAEDQGGERQATIVGRENLVPMLQAAFINGSASHALDYDDVHTVMIGHPSVPVFPAALALAEKSSAAGKDLIAAYVVGVEVECRVGAMVFPSHYLKGWHSTATLGHFGAAAACANLLGLTSGQVIHALGIAGTQAGGLRQVFGTMCKPFHAGKAAMDGLMAALLAGDGFSSSEEIIEGPRGFAEVLSEGSNPSAALEGLGESFAINDIVFKYHASCFETHPAIEAVLSIKEAEKPEPDQVEEILLRLSPLAVEVAGKTLVATGLEAKFSQTCCASLALVGGDMSQVAFTDANVNNRRITDIMGKVLVETVTDFSPTRCQARIRMKDGSTYTSDVDALVISKTNAEKRELLTDKFMDLACPVLGRAAADRLAEAVLRIEKIEDISEFCSLLRPH